jgi:hypothetical protein
MIVTSMFFCVSNIFATVLPQKPPPIITTFIWFNRFFYCLFDLISFRDI